MVTLEDLKNSKKEVISKIIADFGRGEAVRFCSEVLDKRAYFTVDLDGNIKRKKCNYVIPAAVFLEDNQKFIDYVAESLNFSEKVKIDKIERMTNEDDILSLKKNILKLLAKGDSHFVLRYCKELYFKNESEFFKILYNFSLMDNIHFEKPLMVYSLRKYFEKFGYDGNVLYLVISYLSKMRADFSCYENTSNENIISKEKLKEKVKNNLNIFKNKNGFKLLVYIFVLLEFNYLNENRFINIAISKMEDLKNSNMENEKLSNISAEIFESFSKEVQNW